MNDFLNNVTQIVSYIGGMCILAVLIGVLVGLAATVWVEASDKWRAVCKAESLIHEYRKEREDYFAWKRSWTSVKEKDKIPKEECIALSVESSYYYADYLIGWIQKDEKSKTGYICSSDGEVLENVTHWMPLPKPPEKGEGNA